MHDPTSSTHDASFPDAVHQRAAAARVAATHLPDAYAPPPPSRPSVLAVAVTTTLMALCTGLGAAPYLAMGSLPPATAARATAAAAGVMLAASFDLLHEGEPYGAASTAVGAVVGAAFIRAVQAWLEDKEHLRLACGGGAVVVAVMAAHAVGEGAGVGVSFCGARGVAQGALVALAIAIHNLGEGLATATALRSRGVPPRAALAWTLATAAPQALFAVPAFLFVDTFKALLPGALGFAAGCMTWLAAAELLPTALAAAPPADVGTAVTLAAAALEAVRMALATLERPDGSLAPPRAWRAPAAGAPASLAAASLAAPLAAVAGGLTALAVADATPAGASTLGLSAGALAAVGGAGVVRALLSTPAAAVAACGGAVAAVLALRARSPPARAKDDVLATPVGGGLPTTMECDDYDKPHALRHGPPLPATAATAGLATIILHEAAAGWAATGVLPPVAASARGALVGGAAATMAALVTGRSLTARAVTGAVAASVGPVAAAAAALVGSTGSAALAPHAAAGALAVVAVAGLWPAASATRPAVAARTATFGALVAAVATGAGAALRAWV